jgi:hypothetical protein
MFFVLWVSVMLAGSAALSSSVAATNESPSGVSGVQTNNIAATTSGGAIPAELASQHVGETNTVCGLVASARYMESTHAKPTLLNFVKPYPDHLFSVMIPNTARSKFKDPPEAAFTGKVVCVTGAIIDYRGKPEIIVQDPSQMVVKEPAPGTVEQVTSNTVQKALEPLPTAAHP